MESESSARQHIAEARGILLTLMQENDNGQGFASPEWAEEVFQATALLKEADTALDRAALLT